jgi:hypothetical protein
MSKVVQRILWIVSALLGAALMFFLQHQHKSIVRSANARPPLNNTYWTVPNWWIDPANSTGCASNNNTGTSATCGAAGVGPLLTWSELDYGRWGCMGDPMGCPVLAQNTIVTFLSSQPAYNDPVIFHPLISPINGSSAAATLGPLIQITGTLTAGTATTLTVLSSKSRPGNVGLRGTGSIALAQGKLYQNTTRANSVAWFTGWTGGTVSQRNTIAQPMAPAVPAANGTIAPAENDTWATNDNLVPQTPPTVLLVDVRPEYNGISGVGTVAVSHIVIPENFANGVQPGDDAVIIGNFTQLIEVWSQRAVWLDVPATVYTSASGLVNCALDGGFAGGARVPNHLISATVPGPPAIVGGYNVITGPLNGTGTLAFSGVLLDGDTIVRSFIGAVNMDFSNYNYLGFVLSDSTMTVLNGVVDMQSRNLYGGNVVYGTAPFDAGRGQVIYPTGAAGAVTGMPLSGTFKVAGSTVACLGVPSVALPVLTCNKTVSAANLDADLGATLGCYFVEGGGSFCNLGL